MKDLNTMVINVLTEKQTIKSLTSHVLELGAMVEELQRLTTHAPAPQPSRKPSVDGRKPRDYGPASTRKATRLDAWDILFGIHKDSKARAIADATGLSRGQVYSIQGGYTFRDVDEAEFDLDNHVSHDDAEIDHDDFVTDVA